MNYRQLDIKHSYVSYGEENIAKSFLVPMLKQTKLYRRSVVFFSSSVFTTIIDGIVSLSRNNGLIQLIASPNLNADDIEAINIGYNQREEIVAGVFEHNFVEEIEKLEVAELKLLAALIANSTMDIKIAVTNGSGIYHDKFGILEDFDGNMVVFYGSANSTANGYKNNYEKIRVIKSWVQTDLNSIEDEVAEFDSLWNNTNPYVTVYNYTVSAEKQILKVIERKQAEQNYGKSQIKLRDYQLEAINAWVKNGYRGFYVMATGTGKTWTAIYSAVELLKMHSAMIVICAPYKHLVRQWADDIEKVFPDAIVIMVSSENHCWEQQLSQAFVRQRLYENVQIVVISTITSFNLERFKRIMKKSKQEKMLIVDEAHRFTNRSDIIKEEYKYMLGLSATPFSGKNTENGTLLMNFFGGKVFDLPIEKALELGYLVPYNYFPIYVSATEYEEDCFNKKSVQIASCFKNGICVDPDALVLYLRARLRIISMAEEKLNKITEFLEFIKERDHFIVYCGDGRMHNDNDEELRYIEFVKQTLSQLGFKSSQFTASENMTQRMQLVEAFNEGAIDALAAIRCLDEGINIPSIKGAMILSSNDDYREFVQRRGRILRLYKDKKYANIYDVIVLPSSNTPKMAEIELRRFYEYARLAINHEELFLQLNNLAANYSLILDDFINIFDEDKETNFDD